MPKRNPPDGFYWSPSRHKLALACPWCFVRKYVLNVPCPALESDSLTYGKLLHAFLETGAVDEAAVLQLGFTKLESFQRHIAQYANVMEELGYSDFDEREFECGAAGTPLFLKDPLTEEAWNVPFYGIMDRLLRHCERFTPPEWGWVDYKTSVRKWTPRQTKEEKQFTFYCLAFYSAFHSWPKAYLVNFVKPSKFSDTPGVQIQFIQRTEAECSALLREAKELHDRLVLREDCDRTCRHTFCCPFPS
jgi:hypothetical protein